jgi:HD-GYP domain-containing protein (c-di-GMP phosphodiesterase class II)
MTSSRPYRNALTYEDVCSEVEKFQGKQFDPLLSRLFLSIPKNEWESINTKILAQMSVLQKQT